MGFVSVALGFSFAVLCLLLFFWVFVWLFLFFCLFFVFLSVVFVWAACCCVFSFGLVAGVCVLWLFGCGSLSRFTPQ